MGSEVRLVVTPTVPDGEAWFPPKDSDASGVAIPARRSKFLKPRAKFVKGKESLVLRAGATQATKGPWAVQVSAKSKNTLSDSAGGELDGVTCEAAKYCDVFKYSPGAKGRFFSALIATLGALAVLAKEVLGTFLDEKTSTVMIYIFVIAAVLTFAKEIRGVFQDF